MAGACVDCVSCQLAAPTVSCQWEKAGGMMGSKCHLQCQASLAQQNPRSSCSIGFAAALPACNTVLRFQHDIQYCPCLDGPQRAQRAQQLRFLLGTRLARYNHLP